VQLSDGRVSYCLFTQYKPEWTPVSCLSDTKRSFVDSLSTIVDIPSTKQGGAVQDGQAEKV